MALSAIELLQTMVHFKLAKQFFELYFAIAESKLGV